MTLHHLRRGIAGTITLAGIIGVVLAGGCSDGKHPIGPDTIPDTIIEPPLPPPPPAIMLAAGDIAGCGQNWDEETAKLLDAVPDSASTTGVVVATLGDNVYVNGTAQEYADCYVPTWGRHLYRTRPAPGNHDYNTPNAAGYYGYFGARAGDPARGYYSYELGRWHVVVINSNYRAGISTADTSAQVAWLRQDLAAANAAGKVCTVAYWHHPRWTSAIRGSDSGMAVVWRTMYEFGVEVVLVGHDHVYERLAPMNGSGASDPAYGVRQFTVGMAGSDSSSGYKWGTIMPTSEVRQNTTAGILRLSLDSASYSWQYVAVPNRAFTDQGTGTCHGPPSAPAGVRLARLGRRLADIVHNSQQPVPVLWPDLHMRRAVSVSRDPSARLD